MLILSDSGTMISGMENALPGMCAFDQVGNDMFCDAACAGECSQLAPAVCKRRIAVTD